MKCSDAKRALRGLGFEEKSSTGSHSQWVNKKDGRLYKVTLDCHGGEVKAEDIRSMIGQAGVNRDEWYKAADGRETIADTVPVWLNSRHFTPERVRKQFECFDDANNVMHDKLAEHRRQGCVVKREHETLHIYAAYKNTTRHGLHWLTEGDDQFDPDVSTA